MRTYKVIPFWKLRRQYRKRIQIRKKAQCYSKAMAVGAVIGGAWRMAETMRGLVPSWMDLALWLVPAVIQAAGIWMITVAVAKLW